MTDMLSNYHQLTFLHLRCNFVPSTVTTITTDISGIDFSKPATQMFTHTGHEAPDTISDDVDGPDH